MSPLIQAVLRNIQAPINIVVRTDSSGDYRRSFFPRFMFTNIWTRDCMNTTATWSSNDCMYCCAGASLHLISSWCSLTEHALVSLVLILVCLSFESFCCSGTSEVFTAALGAMSPAGYGIGPTGLSPSTDASFYSQASPNGPTPVPNWCGPLTGTERLDKTSSHSNLRSATREMTILFFLLFLSKCHYMPYIIWVPCSIPSLHTLSNS